MTRVRFKRCSSRRRAMAAVELALTLPLILSMLIGLWEVGRVVEVQQVLFNAAREAARQAATGQYPNAQVQQIALNYLKIGLNDTSGTMTRNATVTVEDLTSPGTDISNATTLDPLKVIVSVPFQDEHWKGLTLVTDDSTILSRQGDLGLAQGTGLPDYDPSAPDGLPPFSSRRSYDARFLPRRERRRSGIYRADTPTLAPRLPIP